MKTGAPKVAVVGRGLIGSAAARHLSKMGCEVTLIGPSEPADYARHEGVFGSHYDEGRITRRLETHPHWMQWNQASISRYGEIAAESGIEFYREVGVLHVGARDSPEVDSIAEIADAAGVPCEAFEGARLAERFPFLRSTEGMRGIFEPTDAGYISPRRLVQAQTVAAQRAGARIIDEPALGILESRSGATIKTTTGSIDVERVLVAAGAHTGSLLGRSFGFKVFGRTVAMFRLGEAEIRRLADMPSMRCFGQKGSDPYILPPIPYPDGHTWLKLGSDPVDVELEGEADIGKWFRSGGSVRVAVAFGCYGKSAKCSDEMGRLGGVALLGDTGRTLTALQA